MTDTVQFTLARHAERDFALALVDAALKDKFDLLAEVGAWFQLDWMIDPYYHDVCEAVLKLAQSNQPLSNYTLAKALVGHAKQYNMPLEDTVKIIQDGFGWYHLRFYGREVYDEYRRVAVACDAEGAVSDLRSGEQDITQAIEGLSLLPEKYHELEMERTDRAEKAVKEIIAEIEGVARPRFLLGVHKLDRVTNGFRNGSLITVAAPTGSGKTVFLSQAAVVRAARDEKHVLYFSSEMTLAELVERWAAYLSGVTKHDRRAYLEGLNEIQALTHKNGLLQVFEGVRHIDHIVAPVRAYAATHGVGLICADYIQMFNGGQPKDTRERQVADITCKLKMLAMELHCPVIAASQFNRQFQGTPTIHNLRDSGSIAQDSDVVIIIDPQKKDGPVVDVDFVIAKNRHGPGGLATCQWDKPLFKFQDPPLPFTEFADYTPE